MFPLVRRFVGNVLIISLRLNKPKIIDGENFELLFPSLIFFFFFRFIFSPNSSCNSDFAMEEDDVYF